MKKSVRFAASIVVLTAGLGLGVGTAMDSLVHAAPYPLDPCPAGADCNNPAPPPARIRVPAYVPDEDLSGRGSDGGGGGG